VFVNSVEGGKRLVMLLRLLQVKATIVHAKMSQKRRFTSVERISGKGKSLFPVLVATDVAARGLDIPAVDHVVHYQVPRTVELYRIHFGMDDD
jgi:ATP-dependent RNA helicase DDX24/MAK5